MAVLDRERLRELLAEKGLTPRAVSNAMGDNPYIVRDILSGRSKNPRTDTIANLAAALQVPLSELVQDGHVGLAETHEPFRHQLALLPIRRRVQAGAWLLAEDMDQDEPATYPAAKDPRYPNAGQWLSEVVGDSVNELGINSGDLVHLVDVAEAGYQVNTGDVVEVERLRFQGRECEVSLKQVEVRPDGAVLLWPRSTNPRWKDPLEVKEGVGENEEIEVRIRGLVLAAIKRF